jgi:hypothetical protein
VVDGAGVVAAVAAALPPLRLSGDCRASVVLEVELVPTGTAAGAGVEAESDVRDTDASGADAGASTVTSTSTEGLNTTGGLVAGAGVWEVEVELTTASEDPTVGADAAVERSGDAVLEVAASTLVPDEIGARLPESLPMPAAPPLPTVTPVLFGAGSGCVGAGAAACWSGALGVESGCVSVGVESTVADRIDRVAYRRVVVAASRVVYETSFAVGTSPLEEVSGDAGVLAGGDVSVGSCDVVASGEGAGFGSPLASAGGEPVAGAGVVAAGVVVVGVAEGVGIVTGGPPTESVWIPAVCAAVAAAAAGSPCGPPSESITVPGVSVEAMPAVGVPGDGSTEGSVETADETGLAWLLMVSETTAAVVRAVATAETTAEDANGAAGA